MTMKVSINPLKNLLGEIDADQAGGFGRPGTDKGNKYKIEKTIDGYDEVSLNPSIRPLRRCTWQIRCKADASDSSIT